MLDDDSPPQTELARLWEKALSGLSNVELELALGNLSESDYHSLKEAYITDAAIVMKAMDMEAQEKSELLATIQQEVRCARIKAKNDGSTGE
jgi:hypothetical protein